MDSRIRDYLGKVAWRMRVGAVARRAVVGWLLVAAGGLMLGWARWSGGLPPFTEEIVGLAGGLAVLVTLATVVGSRVELRAAARRVDEEMGGADRMVTAATLDGGGGWGGLVTRDAVAAIRDVSPGAVIRWRWKRLAAWAAAPVLIAIGMGLTFRTAAEATADERAMAADVLSEAAEVLAAGEAEDLETAETNLREAASGLREKLAEAPREDALRSLAQAGAELERLRSERGADGSDGRGGVAGEAGDFSQSAVDGLPQDEDVAEGDGRQLSEAELQQMAERLDEMKRALRAPGGESSPGDEPGSEETLAQMDAAMGAGKEGASAGESGSEMPGGGPGSEQDIREGGELFGDRASVDVSGSDDRAGLDRGEGAAVTVGTVSVDGPGKANTEYRAAYGEAVRAAEGAVEREELPYGSRELVRRYFQRIKPE